MSIANQNIGKLHHYDDPQFNIEFDRIYDFLSRAKFPDNSINGRKLQNGSVPETKLILPLSADAVPPPPVVPPLPPYERNINVGVQSLRNGVTAPTSVLVGTTPSVAALLFDATAELVSGQISMPDDWDGGDFDLVLYGALVNVQLSGDIWDWNIDYVATTPAVTGEGITKVSSSLTPSRTVTTGEGLAVDDVYDLTVPFLASDGNNPLSTAVALICFEMGLANVTGVAAVHLVGGTVEYMATS